LTGSPKKFGEEDTVPYCSLKVVLLGISLSSSGVKKEKDLPV
jgi:uncharacterized ferredoxin-like protein